MRQITWLTAIVILAASVAAATVVWWTPKEKDCPSFTSQAACNAYCVADPARCGGSTACIEHSGPSEPGC